MENEENKIELEYRNHWNLRSGKGREVFMIVRSENNQENKVPQRLREEWTPKKEGNIPNNTAASVYVVEDISDLPQQYYWNAKFGGRATMSLSTMHGVVGNRERLDFQTCYRREEYCSLLWLDGGIKMKTNLGKGCLFFSICMDEVHQI